MKKLSIGQLRTYFQHKKKSNGDTITREVEFRDRDCVVIEFEQFQGKFVLKTFCFCDLYKMLTLNKQLKDVHLN